MNHDEFSAWLQQRLSATGLSIAEVARRYGGRSYQIVWKYTQGIHAPSEQHVDEFARAVDADPNTVRALLGYAPVGNGEEDLQRMIDEILATLRPLSPRKRSVVAAVAAE